MGGTSRRAVRAALAVAIVLLLAGDVVAFHEAGNHATPVSVAAVIKKFRAQAAAEALHPAVAAPNQIVNGTPSPIAVAAAPAGSTSTAPTAAARRTATAPTATAALRGLAAPSPGVYLYATDGHEDASALGGAHHQYPDTTTITVTATGCGYSMRWDALQERYDQWSVCVSGRQLLVQTVEMKHSFYGQNDVRDYTCAPLATFRPGAETAGTAVTGECKGSGDDSMWSGHVVGIEPVVVGGQAVNALHVTMREQLNGATSGTRQSDNWFAIDSGLLVKRVASVDGDSSSAVGRVHYTESVTLVLKSLTPSN